MGDDFYDGYPASRLGGTMARNTTAEDKILKDEAKLLRTIFKVSGVFIFTNRVVIVDDRGDVTVIDQYNGTARTV